MAVEYGTRLFMADNKGKVILTEVMMGKTHCADALKRYYEVREIHPECATHFFEPVIEKE